MDLPDDSETILNIYFDSGINLRMKKSFLMHHSLYFNGMFSAQFIEAQSNDITLRNIDEIGFMRVIKSLKCNHINVDCLEELLLLTETSLLLQFTKVFDECMMIIKNSYLYTIHSTIQIFSFASTLGLEVLSDKARFFILFNFKRFLKKNKNAFFELSKEELQLLLSDDGLNVNDETDVYNLILDWCTETHNYDNDVLYDMVINCINFNSIRKYQLKKCILKAKCPILKFAMEQLYHKDTLDVTNDDLKTILIKPRRIVPTALCAINNDDDGYAYIYRWNWSIMHFEKFIKIDPLPQYARGYQVFHKDLDINIYVYGREEYDDANQFIIFIWKYNLLTEQWKLLKNTVTIRRDGISRFCGNLLYIVGNYRSRNSVIDRLVFNIEKDELHPFFSCWPHDSDTIPRFNNHVAISLDYKSQLVMITKYEPMWYELIIDSTSIPNMYNWKASNMHLLNAIVLCATTYRDKVYVLGFDEKSRIKLYIYYPKRQLCKKIKTFKTMYNMDTAYTFNINKVMVFGNQILECFSLDHYAYDEYMSLSMSDDVNKHFVMLGVVWDQFKTNYYAHGMFNNIKYQYVFQ